MRRQGQLSGNVDVHPDCLHIGLYAELPFAVFMALMLGLGVQQNLHWPYFASLLLSAGLIAKQYTEIRTRDRALCFKAFIDNNRVGMAIFAGVMLDYLLFPLSR